jgi:hypothetical protein
MSDWAVIRPTFVVCTPIGASGASARIRDEILMLILLVPQQQYRLPELERQVVDRRLSFCFFFHVLPAAIPDFLRTLKITPEAARFVRLTVKQATLRERPLSPVNPGMRRRIRRGAKRRRRGGARTARGRRKVPNPSRLKLHAKLECAYGLIRELETTTTAAHDSRAS